VPTMGVYKDVDKPPCHPMPPYATCHVVAWHKPDGAKQTPVGDQSSRNNKKKPCDFSTTWQILSFWIL